MATLAEKLRACVVLDEGAFAHVCVCGSKALTLDFEDLTALADTVELGEKFDFDVSRATGSLSRELDAAKREASEARGQVAALRTEVAKLRAQVDERVSVIEAVKWKEETVGALNAELDAAKTETAALKAKLEERATDADPIAWAWLRGGGRVYALTHSRPTALLWIEKGENVVPLYLRPPAAEALPTREDLETVLHEAMDEGGIFLGRSLALVGEESTYAFLNATHGFGLTFEDAVAKAAALLRAKKAEG